MTGFNERVYEVVKRIPKGRVVTYGFVAKCLSSPRASRQVGWALHKNPYFGVVPCHRVVFADGSLARGFVFGGEDVQRAMLQSEGVEFDKDGKVRREFFQTEQIIIE